MVLNKIKNILGGEYLTWDEFLSFWVLVIMLLSLIASITAILWFIISMVLLQG